MVHLNSYEQKKKLTNGDWSYTVKFNPSPNARALKVIAERGITMDGEDWKVIDYDQSITFPYATVTFILRRIS